MARSSSSKSSSSSSSQRRSSGSSSGQNGGIDNVFYNVVTVLHEKSKGLEAYDQYEQDFEGRDEIQEIFDEIRRNDEQAVQRLRQCLAQLVNEEGFSSGSSEEEEEAA